MIREFVKQLGGPAFVARCAADQKLELSAKSVSEWGRKDSVPYRWRPLLLNLAKKKKIKEVPEKIRSLMQ